MEGNAAGSAMSNGSVMQLTNGQHDPLLPLAGGNSSRYFDKCVPLREAATKGDWRAAMKLADKDPTLWTECITEFGQTVLHVAAGARKTHFIMKLLELLELKEMVNEALGRRDRKGNTAFCYAVAAGAKVIAEMMLNKDKSLLTKGGLNNIKPLYHAALFGRGEMANFLYKRMKRERKEIEREEKTDIFFACLNAHLYDVARELLKDDAELAKARRATTNDTALHILARDPSAFRSTIGTVMLTGIMERVKSTQTCGFQLAKCLWDAMKSETDVKDMIRTPKHLLFEAVDNGNFPLIEMMIHSYPDLAWEQNKQFPSIFHAAIKHRRADIFYLIYDIGSIKDVITSMVDDKSNNMLHLAAVPPVKNRLDLIPGAALQMQQELLWYEEVKKTMEHVPSELKNEDGNTPEELFRTEHETLLKNGEEWMKKTTESCTIVATLIASVVFATAFSVPGGSDGNEGSAVLLNSEVNFLKQYPFIFSMFATSASVALAASTTSILFFLAILISPYSQKEFLNSLPLKLVIGFFMLLISMISMMFAFCIAFMIAYSEKSKSIPWVIVIINIVPIFLFVVLLGPLFWNVCCSTHIRRLFCRQRKLKSF